MLHVVDVILTGQVLSRSLLATPNLAAHCRVVGLAHGLFILETHQSPQLSERDILDTFEVEILIKSQK